MGTSEGLEMQLSGREACVNGKWVVCVSEGQRQRPLHCTCPGALPFCGGLPEVLETTHEDTTYSQVLDNGRQELCENVSGILPAGHLLKF